MTGFVVSVVAGIFALAGLVFDGSRLLAVRAQLEDHAGNAARAAAQEVIDVRLDRERIDPRQGARAAHDYLDLHGVAGEVSIRELSVQVSVSQEVPMRLLTLIGIRSRTVSAVREAVVVDE